MASVAVIYIHLSAQCVCKKLGQRAPVAVAPRQVAPGFVLLQEDFRALPQVADIRFRQVESGADVEHALFQRAVGQVVEIKVDVVQRHRMLAFAAVLVPLCGEALEVADALLGVFVNGDVDDGSGNIAQAGNIRALVDCAVEAVLRIDADDDHVANFAAGDLPVHIVVAVNIGEIEQTAQAEIVGEAAVEQMDVGTGGAALS